MLKICRPNPLISTLPKVEATHLTKTNCQNLLSDTDVEVLTKLLTVRYKCEKISHIAKVCHSKARPQKFTAPRPQHALQLDEHSLDSEPECPEYLMHTLSASHADPILATIELNKLKLQMEIHTGASRSIVGENTFNNYGLKISVRP